MRNFQDTFEIRKAVMYPCFFNVHDCIFNDQVILDSYIKEDISSR